MAWCLLSGGLALPGRGGGAGSAGGSPQLQEEESQGEDCKDQVLIMFVDFVNFSTDKLHLN